MVRRILLLTLLSVSGIALLAPLSARSVIDLPLSADSALLPQSTRVDSGLARGTALSARNAVDISGPAATPEAVVSASPSRPGAVSMQAVLVPIPTPTPAPRRVVTYDGDTVWDRLAMCEASGNWAANTGNGYYGGLQFDLSTWQGYGGSAFAAYPHQATREEQIIVAERLHAARGFQPWPSCRIKLGLP